MAESKVIISRVEIGRYESGASQVRDWKGIGVAFLFSLSFFEGESWFGFDFEGDLLMF